MINIYQLVIGTVSVEIQDCIISVMRFFSDKKKFKHIIVKELPEEILKYGNSNIRNLSDFWKISLLSTKPNSLIIDWDVMLSKLFKINFTDKILINRKADNFLYNAEQLDTFKTVQNDMIEHFTSENEQGQLFKSFCRCVKNKSIIITPENYIDERSGYKHLHFSNINKGARYVINSFAKNKSVF